MNLLLQANAVYENIGLNRQSRSPPADASSVYTSVRRPDGTTVKDEVRSKQLLENLIFAVFSVGDCLFSDLKFTGSDAEISETTQGARLVCKTLGEGEINQSFLSFRRETTPINRPTLS